MPILSFSKCNYRHNMLEWERYYNMMVNDSQISGYMYRWLDNPRVLEVKVDTFWDIVQANKDGLVEFITPNLRYYSGETLNMMLDGSLKEGDWFDQESIPQWMLDILPELVAHVKDIESSKNN